MTISMKPVYQYMVILFNFSPTSSHPHPLQAENCCSNSRLVVDGDDNGKLGPERVNMVLADKDRFEVLRYGGLLCENHLIS